MPHPGPIFEVHGETFAADSCQPLIQGAATGEVRLEALVHGHYPGRALPSSVLPGLKTVGYWDATHDQAWGLEWHRNEGIELTFLESGNLDFANEDASYALRPNDLTITRPWQRHRVGDPFVTAGRLHWVILDVSVRRPNQAWHWPSWLVLTKQDLDELTQILRFNEHPVWNATAEIRHCFQRLGAVVEKDRAGSEVSRLTVLLNELLLLILEMLRSHNVSFDRTLSNTQRAVELFLRDLHDHPTLQGQEWTVCDMASSCGLGITQFIHYCKELTNSTPMRYLNECRLETAARQLLQRDKRTITQIALCCGFKSSQYFATTFQRRFGQTPREFRIAPARFYSDHFAELGKS